MSKLCLFDQQYLDHHGHLRQGLCYGCAALNAEHDDEREEGEF